MPQIDIRLNSSADDAGFRKLNVAGNELERTINRIGKSWGSLDELLGKIGRKFSLADVGLDVLRGAGLGSGWQIVEKIVDHVQESTRRTAEAQKVAADSAERHASALEQIAALERTPTQVMVNAKVNAREAQADLRSYQAMLGVLERMGASRTPEQAKELAAREGAVDAALVKVAELEKAERDRGRAAVEAAKKSADAAKAEAERIAFTNLLRAAEAEAKQLEVAGERELAAEANTRVARMKAIAELGLNTEADARRRYALESDIAEADKKGDTDLANAKRSELEALREIAAQKEASLRQSMRAYLAEVAMTEDKARREKAAAATRADFKKVDDSIQRDLNANRAQQADIENDPLRTDAEKLRDIIPLREAEIQLLEDRARLKKEQRDGATDPMEVQALQAEITRLNDEITKLRGKPAARATKLNEVRNEARDMGVTAGGEPGALDPSKHYQTVGEGIEGGLLGALVKFGTVADQIAAGIESTIGAAVDGITQGIMGWVNGTMTFGQALRNIGSSILQTILQTIIQMAAQMAINAALSKMFHRQEQTETKSEIGQKATAGGMKSIAQLGPIWGPIAFAASVAAIFAIAGKFADGVSNIRGPGTSTSDSIPAWLSNGESVLTARATSMLGADVIDGLNAGTLSPVQALTRPLVRPDGQGASVPGARWNPEEFISFRPTIVMLTDPNEAARTMLESRYAGAYFVNMTERMRRDMSG